LCPFFKNIYVYNTLFFSSVESVFRLVSNPR
jgi:hypothetical protein